MIPALLILLAMTSDGPTEPARVSLNFRDRPLAEVVRAIGDQATIPLSLSMTGINDDNERKITLESPATVPFWEAVDRVCEVASLRIQIDESGAPGVRGWSVSLFGPEGVDPSQAIYSGPFRFNRLSIHAIHDRDFLRDGNLKAATTSQAHFAEFDVLAEPRVLAVRTGPITDLEAVDDHGQTRLDSDPDSNRAAPVVPGQEFFRSFPQRLRVDLLANGTEGGRLKFFRGKLPVEVGVIPSQPAGNIELASSLGKTTVVGDVSLTVETLAVRPGEPARVVLKARLLGDRSNADLSSPDVIRARSMAMSRQIEVADDLGPLAPSAESQAFDGSNLRMDYTFSPRRPGGSAAPTHVRVYLPEWVAWKAPFAFEDVPLP